MRIGGYDNSKAVSELGSQRDLAYRGTCYAQGKLPVRYLGMGRRANDNNKSTSTEG